MEQPALAGTLSWEPEDFIGVKLFRPHAPVGGS